MKNTMALTSTYDNYPFTQDVVLPEISRKERNEKQRDITLREFAEDMVYWILPWFIMALAAVTHYQIFGLIGFAIVLSIMAISGAMAKQARRNRLLLYFFGFASYSLLIVVSILFAIAI